MYLGGSNLEKALLKKAAIQSVALMLGVIMLSYAIKQYNGVAISASNNEEITLNTQPVVQNAVQEFPGVDELEELDSNVNNDTLVEAVILDRPHLIFTGAVTDINNDIVEQLGDKYLVIRKPQGKEFEIQLEDHYITKNLKLTISGFTEEIPDNNYIGRVNEEDIFIGEPIYIENEIIEQDEDGAFISNIIRDYGNDPVNDIQITSKTDDRGHSVQEIILLLDHVYVHILYEDEHYYYIDLKRPKEVYDKILVIDSGHGGKNPGAISRDELTYEKDINLNILLRLKEHLDKDNVMVYYTMLTDETLFLRPRVNLANDVDCDFFISIHCNSSTSTRPNGAEVLYYDYENKNIRAKELAKIFSREISKNISLRNGGILQMKNDDILILNHAAVPAIMVETGYLSNDSDLEYLKSNAGQAAMAKGIYEGIWQAYAEFMPDKYTNE